MIGHQLVVAEPCQPYPASRADYADYRRTQWLTRVVDGLSERELREIVRMFLVLFPRAAEQELLFASHMRCAEQRSDLDLAKNQRP